MTGYYMESSILCIINYESIQTNFLAIFE
nr:unnamed protein product [Callosobruchus analis]